ncbi:DNA-binding transcriptional regulator [Streptomyces spiroverticillatus]|uniref:DNA-binding transcriptional regulator n=1 Tax=Streptomyces finlayi TaxID=67296 RepID=A0A919C7C2_9ACTN|nr:DNA-binding transcriptional regulator [Streptomyces spiroverticillatus]GHC80279.1 DNA-binding transcriptional regulator [Streptomyces finlayi]
MLQTPRDWPGSDLAARLDVDVRTVRRDIDKLRTLGYPVHATPGAPGYRLGAGANLPPLLLDDDEAVAVAVGLRTAVGGGVAGVEENALSALTKLQQVLPSRLRHRVGALEAVTVSLAPDGGPGVDPDELTAVAAACRGHQQLRFDYRGHGGESSVRRTEPHRLVHAGHRWYLVAWDLDRDDWRTFRLDRLTTRIPTGPRFTPRELTDEQVAARTSYGVTNAVYRHRARVTLRVPLAEAAAEVPTTVGVLEDLDGQSCTLYAGSNSLDELTLYLGLFGFPFEVHEPPELVRRVGELAALLAGAVPEGRS